MAYNLFKGVNKSLILKSGFSVFIKLEFVVEGSIFLLLNKIVA